MYNSCTFGNCSHGTHEASAPVVHGDQNAPRPHAVGYAHGRQSTCPVEGEEYMPTPHGMHSVAPMADVVPFGHAVCGAVARA